MEYFFNLLHHAVTFEINQSVQISYHFQSAKLQTFQRRVFEFIYVFWDFY